MLQNNFFQKLYLVKNVGGKNMVVTRFRYIGRWVVIEHDYEKKLPSKQKTKKNKIS